MGRSWLETVLALSALTLVLIGCSKAPLEARSVADANDTGVTLRPRNDVERALLKSIPNLPSHAPSEVAGSTVVAEQAYAAASGRTCRSVSVSAVGSGKTRQRLACVDGATWFFVPDVFTSGDGP